MASNNYDSFEDVKARLDEIVEAVSDDSLPLDDALALYEEAVSLGLRASDLLEQNIDARKEEDTASDTSSLQAEEAEQAERAGQVDQTEKAKQGEQADQVEQAEQANQANQTEQAGQVEASAKQVSDTDASAN